MARTTPGRRAVGELLVPHDRRADFAGSGCRRQRFRLMLGLHVRLRHGGCSPEVAVPNGVAHRPTSTTYAWIFASTGPLPNRSVMAAVQNAVASLSAGGARASISLRSGVPWQ